MNEKPDQFGYYAPELYALDFIYLRKTAIASNLDTEFSVRIKPTEEQWNKIQEILFDKGKE